MCQSNLLVNVRLDNSTIRKLDSKQATGKCFNNGAGDAGGFLTRVLIYQRQERQILGFMRFIERSDMCVALCPPCENNWVILGDNDRMLEMS